MHRRRHGSHRMTRGGVVARAALAVALVAACGAPPPSAGPTGSAVASPSAAPGPASPAACVIPPALPDTAAPWSGRVYYELFVRSFADSDGDGIGDLAGLTSRLDYLNDGDPATEGDLGVSGVWLMPVAESPSYHGYDVTDYRAIEADYGDLAAFDTFVAEAHRRGIDVIVDLVLNHTSRDHPWFAESRAGDGDRAGWYIWRDANPGYGGGFGQQVWHEDGGRWYYGQFGGHMPDLDLENPAVTAELEDVARYWLEERGVDGFRLDAVKHFVEDGEAQENTPGSHAWLAGFQDRIDAIDSDALLVGEVLDLTGNSSSYVPDGVDLTFDFELADKTILATRIADAQTLASTQRDVLDAYPPHAYAALLTNHDQPRLATQLPDPGMQRVAATVLLTNPGLPFVYYGEELGLTGPKPDERIRTPMPWDGSSPAAGFTTGTPWEALEEGWETRNVAAALADDTSLLAHYRALIGLRAAHPALGGGRWTAVATGAPAVYGFHAGDGTEDVLVLVNLGDEPVDTLALELEAPLACGLTTAEVLYRDAPGAAGDGAPTIARPVVDAEGGIDGWQPVEQLAPFETLILGLGG